MVLASCPCLLERAERTPEHVSASERYPLPVLEKRRNSAARALFASGSSLAQMLKHATNLLSIGGMDGWLMSADHGVPSEAGTGGVRAALGSRVVDPKATVLLEQVL